MTEEIKNLLQSIATQLGVTIDYVTQAYVKFKIMESLRFFFIWILLSLLTAFLFKKALDFFKLGSEKAYEVFNLDNCDYDGLRWTVAIILGVLLIIFLIATLCNTDWLIWLFAPEGAFYNQIIGSLKG
jgi:ABC-type Fe3+-siderophore transport system permease subunit